MEIDTNESDMAATISGYDAQVIFIAAERENKSPEEIVLNFFCKEVNAPIGDFLSVFGNEEKKNL